LVAGPPLIPAQATRKQDPGPHVIVASKRPLKTRLRGDEGADFVPSGDGIASALLTLQALRGGDLSERAVMEKLPQRLVNVGVADRDAAMASEELRQAVEAASEELEGRGRVLVRPSGTEQLVRVMVEAPTTQEADDLCERLVAVVEGAASTA